MSLLLSWTANIHASESKRTAGYIVLTTIGQCGPVLGTNIFPEEEVSAISQKIDLSLKYSHVDTFQSLSPFAVDRIAESSAYRANIGDVGTILSERHVDWMLFLPARVGP